MHLPGHVLPRFPRVSKHDTRKLGPISNADWTFPMCSEAEAAASARKTAQNKTIMEECMERKKRTTCLVLPSKLQLDDDFVDLPANGEEYSSRVSTQRGFPSNAQPSQESRSTIQSARVRVARRLPALRTSSPPAARPASLPRSASHATAGCGASAPAPIPGRGESRGGAGMVKRANAFAQHLHSPHFGCHRGARPDGLSFAPALPHGGSQGAHALLLPRAHGMCSNLPLGEAYCISLPCSNPGQSNVAVSPCCNLRAATPPLGGGCWTLRAATPVVTGRSAGGVASTVHGRYIRNVWANQYRRRNCVTLPPPHRPPHYAPHTMPHGVTASSGQKRGLMERERGFDREGERV